MTDFLTVLSFSFSVTGPIFVIIILGVVFMRVGIINDAFVDVGSRLVFNVALPVLLFTSISKTKFEKAANFDVVIFGAIATLVAYLLLELVAKRVITEPGDRGVVVQGSFRSNMGIIGLAYCVNAYGNQGLAAAALYLAVVTMLYNVLSVITLNRSLNKQKGLLPVLRSIAKNPLIISILLALLVSWSGIRLPDLVLQSSQYFANLTLPLALLCAGASLNFMAMRLAIKSTLIASVFKLLVLPTGFVLGGFLLGFRGLDLGLLLLMSSAPTAAASYVMVRAMGGNATLAANIIVVTTLGSIVTTSIGVMILRSNGLM
jgi:hypothetical protein